MEKKLFFFSFFSFFSCGAARLSPVRTHGGKVGVRLGQRHQKITTTRSNDSKPRRGGAATTYYDEEEQYDEGRQQHWITTRRTGANHGEGR